uniref:hypothetical chloroplast RF39 n=1 Tax=Gephyrocapsa parvula TaxID=1856765 RepID=UPI0020276C95|nr:hypothetical chloroplast RF39 [Gephyrocapsa parvula]UPY84684.1 hypothetical chloroplast RF39 [Gephyrocapsa parvula]
MTVLVIGGTGTLGRQIVKTALDEGYSVRCLVRNLRRGSFLKDWGAELVYGDLSLPETIPPSFKGVNIVIDAATVRPTDSYSAEKIDWKGKLALIETAKLAQIKKFISFSTVDAAQNSAIPLLDLKLKLVQALEKSNLNYTVFQCSGFFQGLISQYAIPTLEKQTIWLLGDMYPAAYIDTQDAAKIVIANLKEQSSEKIQNLVGVKNWTPQEIVQICERFSGEQAKISYLPSFLLTVLRLILRSLEFTWNIADRLQFSEIKQQNKVVTRTNDNLLTLEQYLQEYFSKILKKLKETSYQQQNTDISFL